MKQPELGKKILDLRTQKGFTQEELVEKCNINVRTIQRIEAGDVSPRSYTLKAILEVLGYKYEDVFQEKYTSSKFDSILRINKNKIYKQLNIAVNFGIIYFILGIINISLEYLNIEKNNTVFISSYLTIRVIMLISLILFYRGFVISGGLFKNYLLQISTFLIIIFSFIFYTFDSITLFIWKDLEGLLGLSKLITFGALSILLGIGIKRLKNIGQLAKWCGDIEITIGVCFLLIILAPIGLFLQIIVELIEIVLLYRIAEKIKE